MTSAIKQHFKHEVIRKLIHLSSLWMPVAIYILSTANARLLFGALAVSALGVEALRKRIPLINKMFYPILRAHERDTYEHYVGATWVLWGAFFCTFFTDSIAITALCVLVICDSAAALIGVRYGKTPILNKSLQGSIAFSLSGMALIYGLSKVFADTPNYLYTALPAVFIATLVELFSSKIKCDDNFIIPVSICLTMALITRLTLGF